MFDWNRFCEREHDLAGVGGQLVSVTPEELAKHSTEDNAWTAVRGKNSTPSINITKIFPLNLDVHM